MSRTRSASHLVLLPPPFHGEEADPDLAQYQRWARCFADGSEEIANDDDLLLGLEPIAELERVVRSMNRRRNSSRQAPAAVEPAKLRRTGTR